MDYISHKPMIEKYLNSAKENIRPKQHPVELKPSGLVKKHINRTVTNEMNSNFFSAMHHLEKAEDMVQKAHMDSAIEEKKKIKQFS